MKYDVFISFKNTNDDGSPTEDLKIASALFAAFSQRGVDAFYSNIRLFEFGEATYKKAIEEALDSARVMVVISTKREYLESHWVSYERESFHDDILSGRKKDAALVPYLRTSEISGSDVPRSLRNYETFNIDTVSVDDIAEFSVKCLKKTEPDKERRFEKSLATGKAVSRYRPDGGNEFRRLKIQSENTRPADIPAIKFALSDIGEKKKIFILDAGCAYGYVTRDRFSDIPGAFTLGVDINEKCISYARSHTSGDNIAYETLGFETDDFEQNIEELMEKYGIPSFDIIFSSLVIHHLKNPNKFLRRIRKYLSDDGYIILRGSDDGSVIAYGDDGLVEKILALHHSTEGISDRFNGRKLFSQLVSSGYTDVRMMNYIKEISTLDMDEREDVFTERFSYRRNYLQIVADDDPYNFDKRNNLELMDLSLEKLENKFSEQSFWYCETDFVGVAKKRRK